MTNGELKKWLFTLEPTEGSEEIVSWIMEALRTISCTIDVDGIVRELGRQPKRREILYLVAYGTPNLPLELRKKKPFLLTDDDYRTFYYGSDEEWKKCWNKAFDDYIWKDCLIPLK